MPAATLFLTRIRVIHAVVIAKVSLTSQFEYREKPDSGRPDSDTSGRKHADLLRSGMRVVPRASLWSLKKRGRPVRTACPLVDQSLFETRLFSGRRPVVAFFFFFGAAFLSDSTAPSEAAAAPDGTSAPAGTSQNLV